jgi:hypothetical protein
MSSKIVSLVAMVVLFMSWGISMGVQGSFNLMGIASMILTMAAMVGIGADWFMKK